MPFRVSFPLSEGEAEPVEGRKRKEEEEENREEARRGEAARDRVESWKRRVGNKVA